MRSRAVLPLATLTVLAVALGSGEGAPVPTHMMPTWVPYFPTRVGDTWTLQYRDDADNTRTYRVTSVEGDVRGKAVSFGRVEDDGKVTTRRDKMWVSPAGVFRLESGERKLDEPLPLLKIAQQPEWNWAIFTHPHQSDMLGTATARAAEEVAVPAGRFQAIRVEAKYRLSGSDRTDTLWFAPEVGIIIEGEAEEWVMKSFTGGRR